MIQVGEFLLDLALFFVLAYLLAGVLARFRIPGILSALLVGMAIRYTPLGDRLLSADFHVPLNFLAQLGVLFLLFFIGLQIDPDRMRQSGRDIFLLTFLNTSIPFLLGALVMLALDYGWMLAFVIGLTCMPTAEAVIVPILDDFKLIRTRVGAFIIGTGVLDDVIEVFLVALVSVWIGKQAANTGGTVGGILAGTFFFIVLAWICHRWLLAWLAKWVPARPRNLMLLSVAVLFGFGGLSEYSHLGMVVGAIVAGTLMRPVYNTMGVVGEQVTQAIQTGSYGFFGLIFFFTVGLNADLGGILDNPKLVILLYLAGTVGKLAGALLMAPLKKLTVHEAWVVGVGINARLTTEIIVAKLLLDAGLIDRELFTALVTAATFTTVTIPLAFTLLVRWWGERLRAAP